MKETTAARLNRIMQDRNIKQVDILKLAKPFCDKYKIKMNKSDLSQFVSGKVEPGQWKLTILGLALNVSEAWLMGYDVPMERDDVIYDNNREKIISSLTDDSIAIADAYQKADSPTKYGVRKLLDIPEQMVTFQLAARDGQGATITVSKEAVDEAERERQRLMQEDDQPDL